MSYSVSVVVPTRNSAHSAEACLSSVRVQTVAGLELIVVDNFSTDATPQIAHRYADIFLQAGPERCRQRNLGATKSSADFVLFVDSDMVLPPTIVEECLDMAERGNEAVIVPEVSFGSGYWAACKALERSCYVGDDSIEAPRFIQRAVFDRLGGFDERLVAAEDWDLAIRIRQSGATVGRTPTPILHNEGHLTLRDAVRTKFYYGSTMPRYIQKHPQAARKQLRLIRPAYLRNFDKLIRSPALTTGMLLLKSCEIGAGALGALVGRYVARYRPAGQSWLG